MKKPNRFTVVFLGRELCSKSSLNSLFRRGPGCESVGSIHQDSDFLPHPAAQDSFGCIDYFQMLAIAHEEARALGERLQCKALTSDVWSRVAPGCFAVAQQHHSGIVIFLIHSTPLQASAFALLRPLTEAMFRRFRVARCASDEKVENIRTGHRKQVDTATIIREVLNAAGKSGNRADFHNKVWPRLSAYVHTYEQFLAPWLRGPDIEPRFTDHELLALLKCANLSAELIEAGVVSLLAPTPNAV